MSQFIQSLEGRMLFAVTSATLSADLSTIHADAKTVRSDLTAVRATVTADVKTVQSDLKGLSNKTQNNKLMATLRADDAKTLAKVTVAQERYLDSGTALSEVTGAEAKVLLAHSTNSALRSHIAANASKLTTTVASNLAALQTAVNTFISTHDTDLNAIAAADTAAPAPADVASAEGHVAATPSTTVTAIYLAAANQFKVDTGVLASDATSV